MSRQMARQHLDPALTNADTSFRLARLALQYLDAHAVLIFDDGTVDSIGRGRQLGVLGNEDVVEALLLFLHFDAEAVRVDVDLYNLAERFADFGVEGMMVVAAGLGGCDAGVDSRAACHDLADG